MKVVILAGGFGTRISEESHLKPKPMIEIGEQPILWHIIAIIPVAVELGKIVKQDPDIIAGVQTSGATGLAYCLPGISLSACDLI